MSFKELTAFVKRQTEKLPIGMQKIVFGTATRAKHFVPALKLTLSPHSGIPNPARVYWISPNRIVYHTNYLKNSAAKAKHFAGRIFESKTMRGKVVDGNWDITPYKFTDLIVYKSLKERIEDGTEWKDTEFYKAILEQVESGLYFWGIRNKDALDKRCKYLDSLIGSIRNDGYSLNGYDEIDVNIGRNGEYLFQNGVHRLSIAKILGINCVPVMVFVRHAEWLKFRQFVVSFARQQPKGKLHQPLVHPDLEDIPYSTQTHNCQDLMERIKDNLGKKKGVMLDIGANLGFFCHKFEELGYRCYAVEPDPAAFRILKKVKTAENRKFEAINKSILEVEFIRKMKFDVVLALNVFHHFLKTETEFAKFKDLLRNLETDQMFFEAHRYDDAQMRNAFINYTQHEFVDFLSQHTSLNKAEVIYTARNGRTVFKLSKQV